MEYVEVDFQVAYILTNNRGVSLNFDRETCTTHMVALYWISSLTLMAFKLYMIAIEIQQICRLFFAIMSFYRDDPIMDTWVDQLRKIKGFQKIFLTVELKFSE